MSSGRARDPRGAQQLERIGRRRRGRAEQALRAIAAERGVGELAHVLGAAGADHGERAGDAALEVLEHAGDHVAADVLEVLDRLDQAANIGLGHLGEHPRRDLLVERQQRDRGLLRTGERGRVTSQLLFDGSVAHAVSTPAVRSTSAHGVEAAVAHGAAGQQGAAGASSAMGAWVSRVLEHALSSPIGAGSASVGASARACVGGSRRDSDDPREATADADQAAAAAAR